MKSSTGLLRVTLRYSIQRNGVYYFQRPVPIDLANRYSGRLIRTSLQTSDLREAALKVAAINKRLEAEWKRQRSQQGALVVGESVRKQAMSLIAEWGLEAKQPGKHDENDSIILELFYEELGHPKSPLGTEEVRMEAAKLLAGVSKPTLSDALDFCLEIHPKRGTAKFVSDTRRAFAKLVLAAGDKAFEDLNRSDGHKLIERLKQGKSSSGTIRRYVNVCQAIVSMYIREHDLQRTNPLAKLYIPDEGADIDERLSYSDAERELLCAACVRADDDIRWIAAMIADTGARLAEVVGLSMADIVLEHETPHIVIRRHPWRSLKNKTSAREVPLVGLSYWAAVRVKQTAAPEQLFAFPRYIVDGLSNKSTGASNALVRWVRSLGLDHNVHELRHTMNDRLRAVLCPEDLRLSIGGWALDGVGNQYGKGYSLKVKEQWLAKVASPVFSPLPLPAAH